MTTLQETDLTTKQGKAFLRKVIKHNTDHYGDEAWKVRADEGTKWRLVFRRTVKGELGEPDRDVVVETNEVVRIRGEHGCHVDQGGTDKGKPVYVASPRYVTLSGSDVTTLCRLLAIGFTPTIRCSCGSIASSQLGLAFHELILLDPERSGNVAIGTGTVSVSGDRLIIGAVAI